LPAFSLKNGDFIKPQIPKRSLNCYRNRKEGAANRTFFPKSALTPVKRVSGYIEDKV